MRPNDSPSPRHRPEHGPDSRRAAGGDTDRGLSRRRFLGLAGSGLLVGAAAAGGAVAVDRLLSTVGGGDAGYGPAGSATDTDLILVTVQLGGGLDFLDTVIPAASSRYHDLRRSSGVDLDSARPIDGEFSLHPSLPHLAERWGSGELAIVHGVGYPDSSLSHFVDTAIWERGTTDQAEATGWIGRSLDAYGGAGVDALLGVSVGVLTPSMYGPGWNPVALPEDGRLPWTAEFVEEYPDLVRAYGSLLAAETGSSTTDLAKRVRDGQALVRNVADTVGGATDLQALARTMELFEETDGEEETGGGVLARRLSVVADLITGGLPTRAYHVAHGGDFDTHGEQVASLPALLQSLDDGLRTFDERLGAERSRVVVATWTEFGRRPDWNGSGTDHGTAGTQFVVGPAVRGGHHGEPVSLDRFDTDDNFVVTGDYRSYLGGLAEDVLGVEASRVFGSGIEPIRVVG